MWTLKKKMSWNQFDVRLPSSLARTQCAVGVAIRKTSYEPPPPLPFLLLPCIIHSPPMSHPPIHWALANTLQPCTNFQSIKWSQLKPNRRKGQGNSQIWLRVGHCRCTGADLTLTMKNHLSMYWWISFKKETNCFRFLHFSKNSLFNIVGCYISPPLSVWQTLNVKGWLTNILVNDL